MWSFQFSEITISIEFEFMYVIPCSEYREIETFDMWQMPMRIVIIIFIEGVSFITSIIALY